MAKTKLIMNMAQLEDLVSHFTDIQGIQPYELMEHIEDNIHMAYEGHKINFEQRKELIRRLNK